MTAAPLADDWWASAVCVAPPGQSLDRVAVRRLGWELTRDDAAFGIPAQRLAARQGFVLTRAQLRHCSVPDRDARRLVRSNRWGAPHHGVVCPFAPAGDDRPSHRSPEVSVAAATLVRRGHVASHESAATLRGLTCLFLPARVQLTVRAKSHSGTFAESDIHAARLPTAEVTSWFGIDVTSVAGTVVDIARARGIAAGLVVADSALTSGLTTPSQLRACVRAARRRPGNVGAARVVELARAGAESPLESLVRLCLVNSDITAEWALQAPVATGGGQYRVDLLCAERRLIVEADGRTKYRGQDTLWREKLRQEALERAGFTVLRVTWDDVARHATETVARVRAALAGRPRR